LKKLNVCIGLRIVAQPILGETLSQGKEVRALCNKKAGKYARPKHSVIVAKKFTAFDCLAAPARASAAHALVATAVANHDGAADVAAGRVPEVNDTG
jgi:hypothetical protein